MERKISDSTKKIAIILGICAIGLFTVYYLIEQTQVGEGDSCFIFIEVPVNATTNSTIIHLEDKDIMNIKGLDVRQTDGKLTRIYIRNSPTNPEINDRVFYEKYGSPPNNLSLRKYIEYKGVYYYTWWIIS